MQKKQGFTLIELLVVISIIALLIGILLPALGAARRSANRIANSNNVRSILQALAVYASSNQEFLPGETGNTNDTGTGVNARLSALARDNYIVGETARNPVATDAATFAPATPQTITNSSYALEDATHGSWSNDTNAAAVLVGDKKLTAGSFWGLHRVGRLHRLGRYPRHLRAR